MKKLIFILLVLVGFSFAQTPVFHAQRDTSRLSDATEIAGQLILFNDSQFEGIASLFVAGDSISGATPDVTVKYVLYYGTGYDSGDSLWSEKFTLGTVEDGLITETFGDGDLTGETFGMGDDTEWKDALGIRFYFVGTGTHETDLLAVFKLGR